MNREEIICLLDKAKEFQKVLSQKGSVLDLLKGKRIINLFMEPSTRTRVAFEVAAKTLSADIISIAESSSSLTKGRNPKGYRIEYSSVGG